MISPDPINNQLPSQHSGGSSRDDNPPGGQSGRDPHPHALPRGRDAARRRLPRVHGRGRGARNLAAACSMPVAKGMKVFTNSRRVRRARRLVVELLLSEHNGDCQTCDRSEDCELQALAAELGIREVAFVGEKTRRRIDTSTPALVRDNGKCIKCRRCVTRLR